MAGTELTIGLDDLEGPRAPEAGRDDRPAARPDDRPKGLDRVAVVGTFKAPLADTIRWVNYHRNIGIEEIFLFLDDPTDAAAGHLADREGVHCFRCDEGYWGWRGLPRPESAWTRQEYNADLGRRLAGEMGLDWIIHIDSDELIHAERGLRATLSAVPGDVEVVGFRVLEAVPEAVDYEHAFREITLFRDWPRAARHRARLARAMGCQGAFLEGKYFRGHQLKSAVRIGVPIHRMGNHGPYPLDGREFRFAWSPGIELLHYDCAGFEAWMRKWLPRVEGRETNPGEASRARQCELIRRALDESRERAIEVYKQINFIRPYEKTILLALGLLRRIEPTPGLFDVAGR